MATEARRVGEDSRVGTTGKGPVAAKKEVRSGRPWGTVASVFLRSKAKVSEWRILGVEWLLGAANGNASGAVADRISTTGEAKNKDDRPNIRTLKPTRMRHAFRTPLGHPPENSSSVPGFQVRTLGESEEKNGRPFQKASAKAWGTFRS